MTLFQIYKSLRDGVMSHEEAAESFGITPHSLKLRLRMHGTKLPKVLKTLDKISAGTITTKEAAEYLERSLRDINSLANSWKVKRPIPEYVITIEKSRVKWEIRKKCAIDLIAGSCTLEEAAEQAAVDPRQMRRWVSKLLDKHYGMTWKEMTKLTGHRRNRLADEIETAEGLELAKQQVLQDIVRGNREIQEEALARAASKRTRGARVSRIQ